MRLTQPQAVALAHWTPGVAASRPCYPGGPSLASARGLLGRALLIRVGPEPRYGHPESAPCELTVAGCLALEALVAVDGIVIPAGCVRLHSDGGNCGALCWVRARKTLTGHAMSANGYGLVWVGQSLKWAPTAEEWATRRRAERDATEGGAAMAERL